MELLTPIQNQTLEILKRKGRQSIDQITGEIGLAKTAVRRALLTLERRGLLQRAWVPAQRGRPRLAFSLSEDSQGLFKNKESELLEGLIAHLMKHGLAQVVEDYFESYWEKKYAKVLKKMSRRKNKDLSTRLEILVSALEDEGFYPRANLDEKSGKFLLKECHCPISAAARVTDIPCRVEERFIAKVLNTGVTGRGACEFEIAANFTKPFKP